ncbi:hypothetical protein PHISCL_03793 [Aspergillus sclerotialis]|uniref:Uncharacterized protein n=1 Tax=Aspergillus sclerotialis TaxID=2070753 RepID=A0A3A3A3F2_9EURO|nr:hypothetical protein PHISCL_03793 [Aspergillus sclerotialis]
MVQQPTYLLAPSFHFKPGTGPIALGNIVADALRPHRALTTVDPTTLKEAYPRIETITSFDRSMTRETHRDLSMSIWTQFVQGVFAKAFGKRSNDLHTEYTMDALETTYFVSDPPLEEIEARVKVPRVQAAIRTNMGLRRHPVYMVTGLMVAKGFAAVQERGAHRAGDVGVGGDIPTPTGQVGAGANVARSVSVEDSDRWRVGEDIVFAYQLLKIETKGWKGTRIEYDELRHKAAYLNIDDDDDDDVEDDEDVGQVTVSAVSASDLPGATSIQLGGGEDKVTCLSAVDA